jgi:hypothetical protein
MNILLLTRCRNATDDRTGNLASSPYLAGAAAPLPLANTVDIASRINGHQQLPSLDRDWTRSWSEHGSA